MFRTMTVAALGIVWVCAAGPVAEQEYKNYELVIDGKTYELNLDEEIAVTDEGGRTTKIVLRKKPYTEYSDKFVAFQHKSELSVSSQALGDGIAQLMLTTATGTMVMVQEHASMDPSMLVPMMLKELTKESIDYGYKMTQGKVTRKLKSGRTLTGLKATLRYRGEESYWEVLSCGDRDIGILVITHVDAEFLKQDKEMHSHFWRTLRIQF